MAVQGIGPSHPQQQEPQNVQVRSRAQDATTKSSAANATAKVSHPNEPNGTTAAAATENNAGREQGQRQGQRNAESPETKGTLVSVFA